MDDLTSLANPRGRGLRIYSGLIADDAIGANDLVNVRIPTYDPSRNFGPCHWAPRILNNCTPLWPMRNDGCLVALDENDQAEIINWWAEDPTTTPTVPGDMATQAELDAVAATVSMMATQAELDAVAATVSMRKIADATITSTALTFSSIPQTYSHLRMYVVGQSNRAGSADTGLRVRVNGVSSAVYSFSYDVYSGANVHSETVGIGATWGYLGNTAAGLRGHDGYTTSHVVDFPFYSRSDVIVTFMAKMAGANGFNGYPLGDVYNSVEINQAITSIVVTDDVSGTLGPRARASLYGVV